MVRSLQKNWTNNTKNETPKKLCDGLQYAYSDVGKLDGFHLHWQLYYIELEAFGTVQALLTRLSVYAKI